MKRSKTSRRSQKWLLRNSLKNPSCVSYVYDLCETRFDLTNFDIKPFNNGEDSLWIQYGLNLYIVVVDTDDICLKVFKRDTSNKNKDKSHLLQKRFYEDSCWFHCIEWIENQNLL